MTSRGKLVSRLTGAVAVAFLASLALTWVLHDRMTSHDAHKLIDVAFNDVEGAIREKVDRRLVRQAMLFRDRLPALQKDPGWRDKKKSVVLLQHLAEELKVDELCVVDHKGLLTHSANEEDIGFDFMKVEGQAAGFRPLLDRETEITQPLLPNTRAGEMIKYVGVWLPEGGFVQVGCREKSLRYLARSALTGLTHNRHVSGEDGYIVITTASGTIISHPDEHRESGQWQEPGDDCYWQRRVVEGFSVYVVIPKRTAIVERRVLVGTSAFLNFMALILAAFLVGLVIAAYVRAQVRAQRAKEMKMAADIQESAIPRVFPPFPGEKRVDIYANMDTAKEVGGDFYDFYFSGPQKITFLIADVSDKGVPAALFMMRAKTIIKSIAQTGKPVAEVVTEANNALCEGNGANMFVTAWIGELDLESGRVSYVNAGHNPPIIIRTDEDDDYLRTRPGLVLGAMSGVKYRSQEVPLVPGEALYLYTDGLTEQTNDQGEMFGEERLLSFISFGHFQSETQKILSAVSSRITTFAANMEQADDRTQLVVFYRGNA